MANRDRKARRPSPRFEILEQKNLLSTLISSAPTLNIQLDPPHVTKYPHGTNEYSILQPALITVNGTAQPSGPNSIVRVLFFAEDAHGNLVNNGQPLGTTVPDVLGRYSAEISLPSTVRKDVNYLVAYEEALGRFNSDLVIKPTTLSGLTGDVALNGTTVSGGTGSLTLNDASINGLTGTVALNPTTFSGLTTTTGNGNGVVANQTGTAAIAGTTGTTTQTGAATLVGTTGTTTQTGAATVSPTTGTFTQSGTAVVAGTTATSTMVTPDVAASLPVTIHVHQAARHAAKATHATHAHPAPTHAAAVHSTVHAPIVVLIARVH